MDGNRNRHNDHLGINRGSKNIRKSPLHQPNFANPKQQQQQSSSNGGSGGSNQQQQQPQPHVYNINKSDFRSIVQQLTGTPTRDPQPAAARPPAHNPPRPPSTRLHRIRPPPLAPLAPPPGHGPNAHHPQQPPLNPNPSFYPRPVQPPAAAAAHSPAIPFSPLFPPTPPPGSAFWANTLESPISAYMRYLESSIVNTDGSRQPPLQMPPHLGSAQVAGPPAPSTDMRLNPHVAAPVSSPRVMGPPFPASPGLLPSPTSQFVLPSPSAYLNLLSPRSPFPLLSPRLPMTPNFGFSPVGGQPGLWGLGPQPLPSPGSVFPPSPSGFLPFISPRWRDM